MHTPNRGNFYYILGQDVNEPSFQSSGTTQRCHRGIHFCLSQESVFSYLAKDTQFPISTVDNKRHFDHMEYMAKDNIYDMTPYYRAAQTIEEYAMLFLAKQDFKRQCGIQEEQIEEFEETKIEDLDSGEETDVVLQYPKEEEVTTIRKRKRRRRPDKIVSRKGKEPKKDQ